MAVVRHLIAEDGAAAAVDGVVIGACADPASMRGPITALVAACRDLALATAGPAVRPDGLLGELASRPGRAVETWVATAEAGGGCVGLVTLVTTEAAVSVGWLLVSPAWRRRGIGRALVATAANAAATRGHGPLTADTRVDWHEATAFWQAMAVGGPTDAGRDVRGPPRGGNRE